MGDHRPRNEERLEEGKLALVLSDGLCFYSSGVTSGVFLETKQNKKYTKKYKFTKSETHNQLRFPHKLDGVSIFINQLLHIVLLAVGFHQH